MKKLASKDQAIKLIQNLKLQNYQIINEKLIDALDRRSIKKIYSPINLPELPTAGLDGYVMSSVKSEKIKIHKKEISCGSNLTN